MGVIDLTSDLSENEFSDSEEVDEFPYKCQKCPEKFRQMCDVQTHFFGAHKNSEENNFEIKEEAIPEDHGSETNISVNEGPEFSDNVEIDEFPYKCQQCPEKYRQMCEAQTHFFGAHQNSAEDHLEIKEEAIPENHGSESNISVIEVPEFSDNVEIDEFPYKCQQCPEKYRQMSEAQTHFFGAHQNSAEDHLEIKEEAISENYCPENVISENLVSQNIISENHASVDDIFENCVSEKFMSENHASENDIYEICDSEIDIPGNLSIGN